MRMIKQWLCAALVVVASLGVAEAQSKKGANGGHVVKAEGHPIEFVNKGQEIVFYLGDDDGSPLATKNMRGRATIQDAGKTTTVALEPVAPNLMIGKLQSPLGSKARVVFSATLGGRAHSHTLTARYVTD
jgi:hypothetical protein